MTAPFGPTVLLGLAGAGLATLASGRSWVTGVDGAADGWAAAAPVTGNLPLAQALGLVLLACWGVLLVLRGRPRRLLARLGVVAAAATLLTVVAGARLVPAEVRRSLRESGVGGTADVGLGGWYWLALTGAAVALAAALPAAWSVRHWPEMGARYDAVAGQEDPLARRPSRQPTRTDLWRAIDEGHDPTADDRP